MPPRVPATEHHCTSRLLTEGETLKVKKLYAERVSEHADLFAQEGGFTPRPAWQVIEAARRQLLTGELSLTTTPTTHVYLRDGQVYFAERTTDGGLGVRLLVEGVITRQQMGKGALLVSGVEHLGRMFQRDSSIDRQPVELCVELMTDDVLTSVANDVVGHYTMTMYKRHPSGIDRWLPNRIEVITHIIDGSHLAEPDAVITPGPGPRTHSTVIAPVAVEPVIVEPVIEPVVEPEPVAATHAISEEVDVVESDPFADIGAALALAQLYAEHPVDDVVDSEPAISLTQSAVDSIMSSTIADEVAEAVRRALAAIDAAALPAPNISVADFAETAPADQRNAAPSAA